MDHPAQIKNLFETLKGYIENENYRFTEHAMQRQLERSITQQDVLYVLLNGSHEEKKTSFDWKFQTWKYAIRGKTVDNVGLVAQPRGILSRLLSLLKSAYSRQLLHRSCR